jgi:hypothetical protein
VDSVRCMLLRLVRDLHYQATFIAAHMQVFNGFSATLTGNSAKRAADMEKLKTLPGVRAIFCTF